MAKKKVKPKKNVDLEAEELLADQVIETAPGKFRQALAGDFVVEDRLNPGYRKIMKPEQFNKYFEDA